MNTIEIKPAIGIGVDALRANGVSSQEVPVVNTVFPGEHPGQVYPFPKGDIYLTQLGARVAQPDSVTMVMKMLPGKDGFPSEKTYLEEIGLIPQGAIILEVTPQIKNDTALGYPHTDPAGLLQGEVEIFHANRPLRYVSTFSSDEISQMARDLGMSALERPHSDITNNKAHLRLHAKAYAINMFEGMVLNTQDDLQSVVDQFGGKTMWMKYVTGSGGDLVHRIEDVRKENILDTVSKIREEVVKAFEYGSFENRGIAGEDYWPETAIHPQEFPLVIEEDASYEGEIILNGSNAFTTNQDGSVVLHGFFEQLTSDEGEYLGSQPMMQNEEIQSLIVEQTMKLAQYNMQENGYFGNQGADYFVLKKPDGSKVVKIVELNSRPPISMYAHVVGTRLNYPSWINVNVQLSNGTIKDMRDFFQSVGKDLAYGQETSEGKWQVVPLAFRTLQSRTQERGEEVIASPQFKAVLLGQSPEHCLELQQHLIDRGVIPQG